MQNTLLCQALSFERNQQFLFKNLNFELKAGEILEILGANGCGKSTLLRMIAGLIDLQEGSISWNNTSIHKDYDDYKNIFHYLGHQNGLKTTLTVLENIQLYCALLSCPFDLSRIQHFLHELGLKQCLNQQVQYLSAGQARRLALLKLLLKPVPLWILDEPTTALDQEAQKVLMHFLNEHLANGNLVIVATHHYLPFANLSKKISLGLHHA